MAAGMTDTLPEVLDCCKAGNSRDTIVVVRRDILFICIGAMLEFIIFLSLLPENSMQPMSTSQTVVGYTQVPGASVFGLLGVTFGHALDRLPGPLQAIGLGLIIGIPFLIRAAVFALPVWAIATGISLLQAARRRNG
jgi:hypothetical protein